MLLFFLHQQHPFFVYFVSPTPNGWGRGHVGESEEGKRVVEIFGEGDGDCGVGVGIGANWTG